MTMIPNLRTLALLGCSVAFAAPVFGQATGNCNWIGNTNSDWHEAGNWDCDMHGGIPTADDAVAISPGGTVEVTLSADAEAWSLTLGVDDGSSPHSEAHALRTTVDDVVLTVGSGGVIIGQTGFFQLGQHQISGGVGSQPALRATLAAAAPVLVHGRLSTRNAMVFADVSLDVPEAGGARGALQARGWNEFHGTVDVSSGFLQPIVSGSGHHSAPAPHFQVIDGDLIIADGSSVQLFVEADGGVGQPALKVSNGVLDNRGNITTSGFSQAGTQLPIRLDAQLINSGAIRSRLARAQGLSFDGPAGTVHQNSGMIEIGALFGADTEGDAVDGFGLLIASESSLHNTGTIMIHRLRSAEGEIANTDGGLVTDSTEVTGAGNYILGFAGPQAVEIGISDPGTIERLSMIWFGEDHPAAMLHPLIAGTEHWWDLAATTAADDPASGALSLTLPWLNPNDPRVCRFQEEPPDWQCLPTIMSDGQATVTGLTTLSEWAIADVVDLMFADGFEQLP